MANVLWMKYYGFMDDADAAASAGGMTAMSGSVESAGVRIKEFPINEDIKLDMSSEFATMSDLVPGGWIDKLQSVMSLYTGVTGTTGVGNTRSDTD